ncbi:MAG: diacylglycerol kinase family protein [bacterium]
MNRKKFSLRARLRSFRYAFAGLISLVKHEHNSRIHLLAAALAIICGVVLNIDTLEWLVVIIVIGLVFIAELINSSVENLADALMPGYDERIRLTKDYAAAAVLVSAIIALIARIVIFLPKLLARF